MTIERSCPPFFGQPPRGRLTPALALALLLSGVAAGCSSASAGGDWARQKEYGAEMARKGFWREALFRFEKACVEHPDDAELQNNLAVAYEAIGETARALTAYKKALELSPGDAKIKRNYSRFAEYYTSVQRNPSQAPAPQQPAPPAAAPSPAPTPAAK